MCICVSEWEIVEVVGWGRGRRGSRGEPAEGELCMGLRSGENGVCFGVKNGVFVGPRCLFFRSGSSVFFGPGIWF